MFESLGSLFKNTAQKLGVNRQLEASHICHLAQKFLKQKGFTDVSVVSFKNNTLFLKSPHPLVSQKLLGVEAELKSELQKNFPLIDLKLKTR